MKRHTKGPSTSKDGHDRARKLDETFLYLLLEVQRASKDLPKYLKIRCEAWITKLSEPCANLLWKKNRNDYAALLLKSAKEGTFKEPFNKLPRTGPLDKLPSYLVLTVKQPKPGQPDKFWSKVFDRVSQQLAPDSSGSAAGGGAVGPPGPASSGRSRPAIVLPRASHTAADQSSLLCPPEVFPSEPADAVADEPPPGGLLGRAAAASGASGASGTSAPSAGAVPQLGSSVLQAASRPPQPRLSSTGAEQRSHMVSFADPSPSEEFAAIDRAKVQEYKERLEQQTDQRRKAEKRLQETELLLQSQNQRVELLESELESQRRLRESERKRLIDMHSDEVANLKRVHRNEIDIIMARQNRGGSFLGPSSSSSSSSSSSAASKLAQPAVGSPQPWSSLLGGGGLADLTRPDPSPYQRLKTPLTPAVDAANANDESFLQYLESFQAETERLAQEMGRRG